MQLVKSIFSVAAIAIGTTTAARLSNGIAIIYGNSTNRAISNSDGYSSSYLEPFASEDAVEKPFELIDDHEDLIINAKGHLVSLRKRGDDCQKYHKVVRGDNCYLLSLEYSVDMTKILEWNPHINSKCTNLYPGKSYCVKKQGESTLETACVESYYVKSSDNCISVAKAYNLTLNQFYDMNPSINRGSCDNLLTGGLYCVKEEAKKSIAMEIVNKAAKKKISQKKGHRSTQQRQAEKKKALTKTTSAITTTTTITTSIRSKPTHIKQAIQKLEEEKEEKKAEKKKQAEEAAQAQKEKEEAEQKRKEEEAEKQRKKEEEEAEQKRKEEEAEKKRKEEEAEKKRKEEEAEKKRKEEEAEKKRKQEEAEKEEEEKKKDSRKLLQKGSDFTYYWIAHPDDYSDSGKSVNIRTCDGKSLGSVSEAYADALVMEGTGVIGNKVINLGGCSCSNYKCFMEVNKKEDPFGLTSFGTPLRPFITVAANDFKRNTKVFIPQLVGWSIPGSSKKHNGCVLVDDQSWSFDDNHIDFYVYREKNYHTLNGEHATTSVDIYEGGDCKLLNYM